VCSSDLPECAGEPPVLLGDTDRDGGGNGHLVVGPLDPALGDRCRGERVGAERCVWAVLLRAPDREHR
jgi:hypothetical protein